MQGLRQWAKGSCVCLCTPPISVIAEFRQLHQDTKGGVARGAPAVKASTGMNLSFDDIVQPPKRTQDIPVQSGGAAC